VVNVNNGTNKTTKGKSGKKYPLVGVRLPKDAEALLDAALRNKFAKNGGKACVRLIRLHLMPLYGHLKTVRLAVEEMQRNGELQ